MSTRRPTEPLCKYYDLSCKYRNRFVILFESNLSEAAWRAMPHNLCALRAKATINLWNSAYETSGRRISRPSGASTSSVLRPGISYSRLELAAYLRRPSAFSLVADSAELARANSSRGWRDESRLEHLRIHRRRIGKPRQRAHHHYRRASRRPQDGVGSRLLRAAEDRLRAANCHSVILETAVDNRPLSRSTSGTTITLIKTIPRYYSDGVDALC